ncbi:hypothetical protein GCM10022288_14570 [Gryllotalpicola kribbensis]|uniref:DUF2637 domain-containing protein n=1 Tax=Gryllotalpicola kribbensis TaxID=993084 RepID=A0ABP8AQS3_9MICO
MHRTVIALLMAVIAAVAFALSYSSLASLAAASHIPAELAWLYPIQVDGCGLLAGYVGLISRADRERTTRRLAFTIMGAMTTLSLVGNGLHAADAALHLPLPARVVIGAAPALSLLACAELTARLLVRPAASRPSKVKTASSPSTPSPASASATKRAASATSRPSAAAGATKDAVVAWAHEQHQLTGEWPSGPVLGERLGLSRKSGARLRSSLIAETA